MNRAVGTFFALALLPGVASSQVLLGPEFHVNAYTTSAQRFPSVASDGSGNFVVVWVSDGQDGSYSGIFGRRYTAGTPNGEFRVNALTAYGQASPAVAADAAGNFVVAWEGNAAYGYAIWVRRYNATGEAQGVEFQVPWTTVASGSQGRPALAMDGGGNFVVVWHSFGEDGSGSAIRGQGFDALGTPRGAAFQVNTFTTGHQRYPSVASDAAGNFVVAWHSVGQDGNGSGVVARRYSGPGQPVGDEFLVNSYTTGDQHHATVALAESGSFIVAWESFGVSGADTGVFTRPYDASGVAQARESRLNSAPAVWTFPTIASDGARNVFVVWTRGDDIGARRMDPAGTPIGAEFAVNSYNTGPQWMPSLAVHQSGRFVVAWESWAQDGDDYGIFGRRLGTDLIFGDGFE